MRNNNSQFVVPSINVDPVSVSLNFTGERTIKGEVCKVICTASPVAWISLTMAIVAIAFYLIVFLHQKDDNRIRLYKEKPQTMGVEYR